MIDAHTIVMIGLNPNAAIGTAPYFLQAYLQTDEELWSLLDIRIKYFSQFEDPAVVVDAVLAERPWLVGYSCYCWSIDTLLEVAREVRTHSPDTVQVIGGPEVETREIQLLQENLALDFLVTGEGEQSFHELLRALVFEIVPMSEIRGIAYRDDAQVVLNPPRPLIMDLDEIPSPILTGLIDLTNIGTGLGAYQTYRGCVFNCAFCKWGPRGMRSFSLERIEKEMEILCAAPIHWVWICDSVFNINRARTVHILDAMRGPLSRGSDILFCLELDAELLDDYQINFFAEYSRNFKLNFGLQTTTRAALKAARRKLHQDRFEEKLTRLLSLAPSIHCQIDVIYGLPEDNYAGTLDTLALALRLEVAHIEFQDLMLLPGTAFYNEVGRWGITLNPRHPHLVTSTETYPRADMDRACELRVGIAFYNMGLLDGCFEPLERICGLSRVELIRDFSDWFMDRLSLPRGIEHFQENPLPEILNSRNKGRALMEQRQSLLMDYFKMLGARLDQTQVPSTLCRIVRKNYIKSLFLYD
jgi:anaerobic magnesium-protoporphyrin IX monomethyl ester cyclase